MKVVIAALFVLQGAAMFFLIQRASLLPGSTLGVTPWWFAPLFLLGAIAPRWVRCSSGCRWGLTAIGLAGLSLLLALDRGNWLLGYEIWLQRGMPDPGS